MQTPPIVSGGLPVLGHSLEMMKDTDKLFERGYKEHGNIFSIMLGNQPAAVMGERSYNKIFYTETDKSLSMNMAYDFLKASIGEILFTAGPETYVNQRPVLLAAFKRERMETYIHAMNVEVLRWLESLGDSGEMNISREMQKVTQYVAAHAFLGPNFREEVPESFWKAYEDIGKALDPVIPAHWPLPKFKRRDKAKALILEIFAQMVEKRRPNPEDYDDIIGLLLTTPQKDGTFMDEKQIGVLFIGLMFAGHETTAGQAAWSIIQLLQHPQYMDFVQTEVAQSLTPHHPIDVKGLAQLKHLSWAVEETSRIYPSAPMQLRFTTEPVEVGGYTIPAGWRVFVSGRLSHYDTNVFTNPYVYDPLRHSPERREASDPFSIVSFGGGIHKCTGMNFAKNEMAIIAAHLMQQYDLELLTPSPHVVTGVGANRPSDTIIRYRRKQNIERVNVAEVAAAAGCPFHATEAEPSA